MPVSPLLALPRPARGRRAVPATVRASGSAGCRKAVFLQRIHEGLRIRSPRARRPGAGGGVGDVVRGAEGLWSPDPQPGHHIDPHPVQIAPGQRPTGRSGNGRRSPRRLHCTARPRRASKSSRDPYSAGYITCTILPHNMTDQVFAPYNGTARLDLSVRRGCPDGDELRSSLVASSSVHCPLRKRTSMRRSLQYRCGSETEVQRSPPERPLLGLKPTKSAKKADVEHERLLSARERKSPSRGSNFRLEP